MRATSKGKKKRFVTSQQPGFFLAAGFGWIAVWDLLFGSLFFISVCVAKNSHSWGLKDETNNPTQEKHVGGIDLLIYLWCVFGSSSCLHPIRARHETTWPSPVIKKHVYLRLLQEQGQKNWEVAILAQIHTIMKEGWVCRRRRNRAPWVRERTTDPIERQPPWNNCFGGSKKITMTRSTYRF